LSDTTLRSPGRSSPDYRLVHAFVWGEDANCDTDGKSHNPASREWTQLYAQNRALPAEVFEIRPYSTDTLVLEVASDSEWLAAAVAFLLAVTTGGTICNLNSRSSDRFGWVARHKMHVRARARSVHRTSRFAIDPFAGADRSSRGASQFGRHSPPDGAEAGVVRSRVRRRGPGDAATRGGGRLVIASRIDW